MGDRGNIIVNSQRDGTMHFYTHWSGSDLPAIVAAGLDRGRGRWDDEPYLNRILFCEMIQDDVLGETGYGISREMGDGGTEVYIDHDAMTVRLDDEALPFEQFIAKHRPVTT
jgi:hypothetical protein